MYLRICSLSLFLFITLFSCAQHKENSTKDDDYQSELDSALVNAMEEVRKQQTMTFSKNYKVASPNEIEIMISQDYFFSKETPHLFVRRNNQGTHYIDIFQKEGIHYRHFLSHQEWIMTYVSDTIQDINGDGYNDFVVNGYGSSGCCLKAYSFVYLFHSDSLNFSQEYGFLNPTFSPKEKVVRGVCYGHPGETEMYKYGWVGRRLDTLEYVSYEKDELLETKTGYILISTSSPSDKQNVVKKRLVSVPEEYVDIFGYDWFTGNIEGY